MKSSELKSYIKEIIVSELSETTIVGPGTDPNKIPDIAKSEKTDQNTVRTAVNKAKQTRTSVSVAEEETNEIKIKQSFINKPLSENPLYNKLLKIFANYNNYYLRAEAMGINISNSPYTNYILSRTPEEENQLIEIINILNNNNIPYFFYGKYPNNTIYSSNHEWEKPNSIYDLPTDVHLKLYIGGKDLPFKNHPNHTKPENKRIFIKSEPIDKIMINFIKNNIPVNPDESTTFHFPLDKINPEILQYLNKNKRLDIDMKDPNYGHAVIYKNNKEIIIEFNPEYKPDTLKSRDDLLKTIRSRPRPDDEIYPEKYMFKNASGVASESINEDEEAMAGAEKHEAAAEKLAKITSLLKELEKSMKHLAEKWKQAEGEEKENILNKLKEKTKTKKELKALQDKYAERVV
jgi:hypothetical protein